MLIPYRYRPCFLTSVILCIDVCDTSRSFLFVELVSMSELFSKLSHVGNMGEGQRENY